MFENVEEYCSQHALPAISREQGQFLAVMVNLIQPKLIVEVGTCVGYSTLWLAYSVPETKVITLEKDPENAHIAQQFFNAVNADNITIILGDAKDVLRNMNESIDLLFLDATKAEYLKYFHAGKHNLHKGSVIIADNMLTHAEKLKDYKAYMQQYQTVTIPFKNGMEVTIV